MRQGLRQTQRGGAQWVRGVTAACLSIFLVYGQPTVSSAQSVSVDRQPGELEARYLFADQAAATGQAAAALAAGTDVIAVTGLPNDPTRAQSVPGLAALLDAGYRIAYGHAATPDRTALVYNTRRLTFRRTFNIVSATQSVCGDLSTVEFRPPLVGEFVLKRNGRRFWFMVTRFADDDPALSQCQQSALNTWSRKNTVATVMLGAMGSAPAAETSADDQAFYVSDLRVDGVYRWLQPQAAPALCQDDLAAGVEAFLGGGSDEPNPAGVLAAPSPAPSASQAQRQVRPTRVQGFLAGGAKGWQARAVALSGFCAGGGQRTSTVLRFFPS